MIYEEFIGAIKIKDGLFIGDQQAVKDLEFILTNKVTHIINAAGKQIDNMLENLGVQYLTFYWQESDKQILFDKNIETVNQIVDFIEEANQNGESCLVHSVRGQSRACCILTAYFMRKYQWTLLKTLDYLNSRRPDLEIRATFFEQLKNLELYLQQTGQGAISQDWNQSGAGPDAKIQVENSPDEILIRNTYVNSKQGQIPDYYLNIGKPQRFGGYSPYKKPAPTKIIWLDEVSNNKKKLVQVLNQSQSTGKKGASVQHRKPSPAPFKRAQQQALKQIEQQQTQILPQNQNQDYIDSILKGSNKIFKKITGEELSEVEINQIKQQANQPQIYNNSFQQSAQKSNENSANKPPQNPMSSSLNKLNSNRVTQQESDAENGDSSNPSNKSITNKENSSRPGSTRDESLLQDKNANEVQYQQYSKLPQSAKQEIQQVKIGNTRGKEVGNSQSLNNQIYNNTNVNINNSQIRQDNSQNTLNSQNINIKNKYGNDGNAKVNNINGNIINLTVNNFVNANVATGNVVQQGFQIANVATNSVIGNSQQIPGNYDMNVENLAQQPFIVQYPQNGIDFTNMNSNSYVKSNNSGLINNSNNSSNSNQNSAGKQYKQYSSDPSKLQNYYKFVVEDKAKNQGSDFKNNGQGAQLPMAQQIIFQNQQMLLMQKQQQQQQQHQALNQNIQLTQQQQQAQQFNIQQIPISILQNQQTSQNSGGQNSNSQILSKMLSKNNTYHHSDMVYQKVISKSFNQSKIKQEMVFGQNQYQFPKEINNYSLIKNDLSDSKITKNMMKQKQNIQNSQLQQQPISHKFPIKANPDLFEKRPNSANTSLPQGRQAYNGFVVMTNNFMMGTNHMNNNNNYNENENNNFDSSNINKRPSSTGGGIRSFSPGSKNIKPQNLPNSIKPQLIVTNQNGSKKTGMRYPSPAINSSSQNTYQMSVSQKNKWK
ncbi:dual specificity phosphatase domain protein (macronuclear) [Tetrahymena thermophila SB210]|uniref:Dual specificity phosphatase domain protein n=1 Tax=Tetrahymena thermophila (strain SB210) TaxID=312017 RepID=I7MFV9_TETTS|nr:dual specificity phosphatase domain protein [Tetrahymena thermophila SB210]EAS00644.2 dual specificity phosphatase domain protein [Tetrahymena thermophila SB210]|eukprot:XP_001020889.2 dual specificity phosphatase domain protein [Tetrahymena thermophila SB210]